MNYVGRAVDFFMPTERNRGIPISLSRGVFVVYFFAGTLLLMPLLYFTASPFASLIKPFVVFKPEEVVSLVNKARSDAGLKVLRENVLLELAARAKLEDMLAKQYFAHYAPDGSTPWSFLDGVRYRYRSAGENLALDFLSAKDAHSALMSSPTHRANILNPNYKDMGIAVESGGFQGRQSIVMVQLFGTLLTQSAAPAKLDVKTPDAAPVTEKTAVAVTAPEKIQAGSFPEAAVPRPVFAKTLVRFFASLVLALVLIPLLFLLSRRGKINTGVLTRTAMLLLLFSYIALADMPVTSMGIISPSSAAIILLSSE